MRKILGVLGALALVLAVTGTATGTIDRLIRSSDVKNGSLTGRDVKNRSLAGRDIAPRSIGAWRISKRSIRLLERDRLTAPNPAFGGIRVRNVPGVPLGSGEPEDPTDGTWLYRDVRLRAGKYLVQGSVIFFDFTAENAPAVVEYGVTQVFLDDEPLLVGTNWSADIPDDGNNGASSSGSFVLDVPPGGGTLRVRVIIRTDETQTAPAGHAGGNLIVTRLAAP